MLTIKKPSTAFWTIDRDGMTQSMLLEFLACRKRADLSYKRGWATIGTSHPLTFGTLFHECLARIYKNMQVGVDPNGIIFNNLIDTVLADYKKDITSERDWTINDAEEIALCEGYLKVLLPEYVKQYRKKDMKHTWLLVEDEFKNKFGDVTLRGKFDRVSRNPHGEVWIHETKTKYIIDPTIQDRLSFDPQVMIYILNYWLQFKEIPRGFVYDIIQRPRLRRGKEESLKTFIKRVARDVDGSYFMRIRMRVTKSDLKWWIENEFKYMVKEFREWAIGATPTYRNPASCETKFGNCKFMGVCGTNSYQGLYQRKRVFPELNAPKPNK